jgi:hypothetical protein
MKMNAVVSQISRARGQIPDLADKPHRTGNELQYLQSRQLPSSTSPCGGKVLRERLLLV